MQLSSKASSAALKCFTNAHSPYWHVTLSTLHAHTFKVTRHQRYRNCDIKSCASPHNLLFGLGPLLPCLHLPIPSLQHRLEQQLCHPPCCSDGGEAKQRCSAALLHCQHPSSSSAKPQGSVTPWEGLAVLGKAWVRKGEKLGEKSLARGMQE